MLHASRLVKQKGLEHWIQVPTLAYNSYHLGNVERIWSKHCITDLSIEVDICSPSNPRHTSQLSLLRCPKEMIFQDMPYSARSSGFQDLAFLGAQFPGNRRFAGERTKLC